MAVIEGEHNAHKPPRQGVWPNAWLEGDEVVLDIGVPCFAVEAPDREPTHAWTLEPAPEKGEVLAIGAFQLAEVCLFIQGIV